MLDNDPFSGMSFASVFPSQWFVLTASFTEQKLLILTRSSFSALSVMDRVSGVVSEKPPPHPGHLGFLVHCFLGVFLSCILNLGW